MNTCTDVLDIGWIILSEQPTCKTILPKFISMENNLTTTIMGHSRKHPYHPHGGNGKLTPLPPSDVLIHLLLSETIFSPLPLRTAEISSVHGGVWIFSGTTQSYIIWMDQINGTQCTKLNLWYLLLKLVFSHNTNRFCVDMLS